MGPAVTDAIPSLLCIDVVSKRINRLLEFSDPARVNDFETVGKEVY
jgi:hypothetical protein